MKKIIILTLVVFTVFSGLQAQKNGTRLTNVTANGKIESAVVNKPNSFIQLPEPQVGLEAPLYEALKNRATVRNFAEDKIEAEFISSLLWSAYGFNRPGEGKRVVPSAMNVQEFDIYFFDRNGIYLYDAEKNGLQLIINGDHRKQISTQPHFAVAPMSIVIVVDYDRMAKMTNTADRDFYAAVDCGYISQNIYLFCASANLGTVACGGIDRDKLAQLLNLKNSRALLAHPIGMKK